VASKSRSLLHAAMLGHLFSAVDNYLYDLANEPWLQISTETRNILRKSKTKPGNKAYSIPERFAEIGTFTTDNELADEVLLEILTIWRNQSVHELRDTENIRTRLSRSTEDRLLQSAENLKNRYGKLDAKALIEHIKENKTPTRKDIVALASAAQNYLRAVDGRLLAGSLNSQEAVQDIALTEIRNALLSPNDRAFKVTWGKAPDARVRRLVAILQEAGFAPEAKIVPRTSPNFLLSLAESSAQDARNRLAQRHDSSS